VRSFCCLPLLAAVAAVAAAQQPSIPGNAGNFSIPAQLETTVRAEKAHPGDVVHFKTIQAVLVGQGLVMPENTQLYGHVLGAAPLKGDKASWVSVMVDRAEWKEHRLPLRAFIAGQITSPVDKPKTDDSVSNPRDVNGVAQQAAISRRNPLGMHPGTRVAPLASDDPAPHGSDLLADVKLGRTQSGATFLVCQKHNLKIPGGLLFTLMNVPAEQAAKDGNPADAVQNKDGAQKNDATTKSAAAQ
jgi:hypothetical protein